MKTALVTGASAGIGLHTARALVARGFHVIGASRRERTLPAGVVWQRLDVSDERSVADCFRAIGALDVLVNNAGIMLLGAIEETEIASARAVFETNFFGVARVTQAALPLLRASGGRVINVGSIAGVHASPLVGYYAATKHALEGYTEALRAELKPLGVDACIVEPSDFRTQLFECPTTATEMSEYDALRRAVAPFFSNIRAQAEDPELVACLVAELACAKSTKLRNRIGKWGRWLPRIKSALPQRAFERFIEKGLRLDSIAPDASARDRHV